VVATPPSVPAAPEAPKEDILFEVFDSDEAKVLVDRSISDAAGGFFMPAPFTYSETKPNPVKASFSFDEKTKLVRLNYDVPVSVGYFGGAGVTAFAPNDGKDLSSLIKNGQVTGLLVLRLGSQTETRVKVSVIGPQERADSSYPFFILPLKPGLHTYGLELADFKQPPWAATAPSIEQALSKVVAVSVEFARGNANGMPDKGEIEVGDIRFSAQR
jgi:hypothetical protein